MASKLPPIPSKQKFLDTNNEFISFQWFKFIQQIYDQVFGTQDTPIVTNTELDARLTVVETAQASIVKRISAIEQEPVA